MCAVDGDTIRERRRILALVRKVAEASRMQADTDDERRAIDVHEAVLVALIENEVATRAELKRARA